MKPNSKGGNNSSGKAGGSVYDSLQSKPKYRLALFDHLPRKVVNLRNRDSIEGDKILHPATLKLGGLYSDGTIQEDDDRVTALMAAFYNIIEDYKTPPNKILREDLDRYISKQVRFDHSSSDYIFIYSNLIFIILFLGSIPCRFTAAM